MGANKLEYFGVVKIDLTGDTITADKLLDGFTAHDKAGEPIIGTYKMMPLDVLEYDWNIGYVDNGVWKYENPTNTYIDIYEVEAGVNYMLTLSRTVGTRFRAMFTTRDIRTVTKGNVSGTRIINTNSPAAMAFATYTPESNGYILVAKDNVGTSGLKSYLFYADEIFP